VEEQLAQWACTVCTYLNEPNHLFCAMCRTQRPGERSEPKVPAEQPKAREEQPKAPAEHWRAHSQLAKSRTWHGRVRSEQPKAPSELPRAYTEQPKLRNEDFKELSAQPIARAKRLPEPVASTLVQTKQSFEGQHIMQQSSNSTTGNARKSIPEDEAVRESEIEHKSLEELYYRKEGENVPNVVEVSSNSTTGKVRKSIPEDEAVRESEIEHTSLEELYDQKEGDNVTNVVEVSPTNRRRALSVLSEADKDKELEWSSFEDESFEEEMTADFQRRIIGQTVAALKIKGGASCLSTLAEIANNLRFNDARCRTIITTGRKFKTRSFFIHKEAVGAIEAIGFVPVGSQNEVFAWDPEFSALSIEEIIEAVDKHRKINTNARSEMSFMTADTEEINSIHKAFGEEDQQTEMGVHIMSE